MRPTSENGVLFLKDSRESLARTENYLRGRKWSVTSLTDLNMLDEFLLNTDSLPKYAIFCLDHRQKQILLMPSLVSSQFGIRVIGYFENQKPNLTTIAEKAGVKYILRPPVSGPSVERMFNKIKLDEDRAAEKNQKEAAKKGQQRQADSEVIQVKGKTEGSVDPAATTPHIDIKDSPPPPDAADAEEKKRAPLIFTERNLGTDLKEVQAQSSPDSEPPLPAKKTPMAPAPVPDAFDHIESKPTSISALSERSRASAVQAENRSNSKSSTVESRVESAFDHFHKNASSTTAQTDSGIHRDRQIEAAQTKKETARVAPSSAGIGAPASRSVVDGPTSAGNRESAVMAAPLAAPPTAQPGINNAFAAQLEEQFPMLAAHEILSEVRDATIGGQHVSSLLDEIKAILLDIEKRKKSLRIRLARALMSVKTLFGYSFKVDQESLHLVLRLSFKLMQLNPSKVVAGENAPARDGTTVSFCFPVRAACCSYYCVGRYAFANQPTSYDTGIYLGILKKAVRLCPDKFICGDLAPLDLGPLDEECTRDKYELHQVAEVGQVKVTAGLLKLPQPKTQPFQEEFLEIDVAELPTDIPLGADCFLRFSLNRRFLHYLRSTSTLSPERRRRLIDRGTKSVFLRFNDIRAYELFRIRQHFRSLVDETPADDTTSARAV